MPQRRYSDEERAAALAALKANGGNAKLTARQAGVPESTLKRWRTDPGMAGSPSLRAEKEEELSVLFDRVARRYIGRALDSEAVNKTSGKDAVIAAATATDKRQLLTGASGQAGAPSVTIVEVVVQAPRLPPPTVEVVTNGRPGPDGS